MFAWEIAAIASTEEVVTEMLEHHMHYMPNTASDLWDEAMRRGSEDKVLTVIKPLIDKQLVEFWH